MAEALEDNIVKGDQMHPIYEIIAHKVLHYICVNLIVIPITMNQHMM